MKLMYRYIDGVGMGSPLEPTVADLYMSYLENNILSLDSVILQALGGQYCSDLFN